MTSLNVILHVSETRKFVMATLHGKQGLICDETRSQGLVLCRYGTLPDNYINLRVYFISIRYSPVVQMKMKFHDKISLYQLK